MSQTYGTFVEVLAVLHQQGSTLITLDVLEEHATIGQDFEVDEKYYPCLSMANGVRWFFDRTKRPPGEQGPKKALAPSGVPRQLLGALDPDDDPVLFEGERDWLTALSVGLHSALCVGGATNLDEAQVAMLVPHSNVVLLFDNDSPGRASSDKLAAQLVEAGCRSVKLGRIPLADADYSDWAESLPAGRVLEITLTLIQQADKIGKREAKRIRKEQKDEKDSNKPIETDEFTVGNSDLVVAIWKPGDPQNPHESKKPGFALFAHFDHKASTKNNLLVVNELKKWEEVTPPQEPDLPEQYRQEHRQEQPAVFVPLAGDTFQKRIIVVPSGAEDYSSSEELFDGIRNLIDTYFVIDPNFICAMTAYVLMSYRYRDAGYEVVPYIRVVGQAGKGKTRFLRIMRELCFRTIFVAGIRPAHLYRILGHFQSGVTMIFEEFNLNDNRSEAREYIDMLNAGNQKDTFVPRMSGRQFDEISWLPLFSPKVLTTTSDFINEGLIRRCFTGRVGLLPIPDHKLFESLPAEFYVRSAELRRKLLGWRFMKFGKPVNSEAMKYRNEIDMGIWQNFFPAVAMIPEARKDAIEKVLELATTQEADMDTTRSASPTARVLESAIFVADPSANPERAWSQDILVDVIEFDPRGGWTLENIRRLLRENGLNLKRSAKTIDGKKKFDLFVDIDEFFQECLKRHSLDITTTAEERGRSVKDGAGIM